MTDKELLDLALEALRSAAAELYTASSYCNTYEVLGNTNDAITAIQQALAAQPAPVQEPVYLVEDDFGLFRITTKGDWNFYNVTVPGVKKTLIANATPPAQPAPVQEPVAWAVIGDGDWGEWVIGNQFEVSKKPNPEYWEGRGYTLVPLYTTPPAAQRQWVGLTDEERDDVLDIYITAEGRARAIEAKLKELNT